MSERLVAFLYLLARDEVAVGAVERLMVEVAKVKASDEARYSNPHLEAWARESSKTLLTDRPFLFESCAWLPRKP